MFVQRDPFGQRGRPQPAHDVPHHREQNQVAVEVQPAEQSNGPKLIELAVAGLRASGEFTNL